MRYLTIGTFDVLHWGHLEFLYKCADLSRGDLVIGLNSDKFVEKFKGERPVMSYKEREHALKVAGYAIVRENRSAGKRLIERFKPDVIYVGSDWARKYYLGQIGVTQDWLDKRNITVAYVPYVQTMPISTSEIKRRIRGED